MDDIKVSVRTHILQKMHIDRMDHVALVAFSNRGKILCDWARLEDPSPLLQAVDSLSPDAITSFRSGLKKAEELFGRCPSAQGSPPLRKIVFFSDGKNNKGNPMPVAERLKKAGGLIQTIGFGPTEDDVDADKMRQLASVVDGQVQYWFCRDARELTRTLKTLSGKTRVYPTRSSPGYPGTAPI